MKRARIKGSKHFQRIVSVCIEVENGIGQDFSAEDVEFEDEIIDYWEKLRHKIAIASMNRLIYLGCMSESIAEESVRHADALVKELKIKQENKKMNNIY